ncbi:hypothetical protein QR680_005952 [Steinernema hermaphroditum]|uniref:CAP-Gly domain-containing protein n=1 Tax=Steinernema hermaphroditum TaxID=289476 RepID=A0AA39HTX3_9BILA|nr:hypothetical protein QR680_005952 [Steinernema hermaphroditum]
MAAPEGPRTIQLQILSEARLETIVGIEQRHMKLELRTADGRFFSSLTNDNALLSELNVENKMIIFVHNTGGAAVSEFDDVTKVEKYQMDDGAYDSRENSVRAWKKKILAEKASGDNESLEGLNVGDSCIVQATKQCDRKAKIAFLGTTQFSEGNWVGVVYDEPLGKNDGSVNGLRYFTCENLHGGFVKPRSVVVVLQEEEMEEI